MRFLGIEEKCVHSIEYNGVLFLVFYQIYFLLVLSGWGWKKIKRKRISIEINLNYFPLPGAYTVNFEINFCLLFGYLYLSLNAFESVSRTFSRLWMFISFNYRANNDVCRKGRIFSVGEGIPYADFCK